MLVRAFVDGASDRPAFYCRESQSLGQTFDELRALPKTNWDCFEPQHQQSISSAPGISLPLLTFGGEKSSPVRHGLPSSQNRK